MPYIQSTVQGKSLTYRWMHLVVSRAFFRIRKYFRTKKFEQLHAPAPISKFFIFEAKISTALLLLLAHL